ncbi:hypothetical protein GCM10007907_06980 [Chitinimonas prasina]|uniref:Uncharacterized protein n=1 Tax=Chitinimonas prasina TaxID=1434937 RepID=A0ABQ5YBQ5_9NEIS|nr:hypothetical protein [Chitinimonas prasina]GLR11908.1 hypothetical protein GCM10007907_06980 [Chitinimonas prasina]
MRVKVGSVKERRANATVVAFDSSFGGASAYWIGTAPVEGASYDVEMEVSGVLTWGAEIAEATVGESIFEEEGCVCLVGSVQSLSNDGVAVVQLGNDIVLVETVCMLPVVPRRVKMRVPKIMLFDTNT